MKPRFPALEIDAAPSAARPTLESLKKSLGMAPNLHRTLAQAPAALRGYVAAAQALAAGQLPPALRESIAVTTAGLNACGYCAAAHTQLGKGEGLGADELRRNLSADSEDPKVRAALVFVRSLLKDRGAVADVDFDAVRAAGWTEAEIIEITAHVGLNGFTNMFNRLARTAIDFPEVAVAEKGA